MARKAKTLAESEREIELSDEFVFLGIDKSKFTPQLIERTKSDAAAQYDFERSPAGKKYAELQQQIEELRAMPDISASDVRNKKILLKQLIKEREALEPSAPSLSGLGLSPKKFIQAHAMYVLGGAGALNAFFKGRTRIKGEIPEAAKFKIAHGSYNEAAIVEHLKSTKRYSEFGFGSGKSPHFSKRT